MSLRNPHPQRRSSFRPLTRPTPRPAKTGMSLSYLPGYFDAAHLVFVIVKRLDAFFILDIPQFDQSIRRRSDELLAHTEEIDTQH